MQYPVRAFDFNRTNLRLWIETIKRTYPILFASARRRCCPREATYQGMAPSLVEILWKQGLSVAVEGEQN